VRVSRRSGFPWQRLVQVGPFHWDALAPGRASRVAVGVLAPLTLGWASGHLDSGAFAALGALPAGFASFQKVTRSRLAAVVVASLGMAVSTCIGATTAATIPWLLVPVVLVWGYVTGLMVCLGPRLSGDAPEPLNTHHILTRIIFTSVTHAQRGTERHENSGAIFNGVSKRAQSRMA
jgi:hypothetical protein